MLKTAASRYFRPNKSCLRALHTRHAIHQVRSDWARSAVFASATASATAILVWCVSNNVIHNDVAAIPSSSPQLSPGETEVLDSNINSTGVDENGSLQGVAWGSNKSHIINPTEPKVDVVQYPTNVNWLENVALRDLALHDQHACMRRRPGKFSTSELEARRPKPTLLGKDIVKIQVTESRVYALSASGKIYVLAANEEQQKLKVSSQHPGSSWWSFDWLWRGRPNIDLVELFPREKLGWREHFTNITAGRDHVLALTSAGRAFSHPVNKNANSHGQLGLRNVDLPVASSSPGDASSGRVAVELSPVAVTDPYAKASRYSRVRVYNGPAENLDTIDDKTIRFCDSLFEIPALKGVKVSHIAAGSRSSYVNTDAGRVLGWGANEFGQLGLGNGITLDAVTIPTEVILTRNLALDVKRKCLGISAGGDLTFFVAERTGSDPSYYIDVLSCGNGQWGGLGANLYTTSQANPVRVKNVSGLLEYDEKTQGLAPIVPEAISVSPTGHALLTLDTLSRAGPGFTGRDLLVWGLNYDFQLGTGKRKSLPAPAVLNRPEGGRFLLARKTTAVKDMAGNVWRKKVGVEQCAIAGYGNSFVYWRIIRS
ncbi:regulator of chromosome condensation 1/beta-lactamase-inhibitor protein II [Pisolithus orientalis]|uniref:regulator of chromosome condensation 1/beta-lactamase-inhibitor protein II n=1 Tax=Pisolithus orientalis TaxID=936130 RepID=UPI0022242172|nr:regulator of chromosome condensation 1/beta-lactamase-inhibitor protein II [Pisolithus orientalis]KAI6028459.1 regulator of chromosome condensation 1/beta-lactamase-inhibitor protein II [Pisolithus orientalis]